MTAALLAPRTCSLMPRKPTSWQSSQQRNTGDQDSDQIGIHLRFFVPIHDSPSEEVKLSIKRYSGWKSTGYTTEFFLKFTVDGSYGSADGPQVLDMTDLRQ